MNRYNAIGFSYNDVVRQPSGDTLTVMSRNWTELDSSLNSHFRHPLFTSALNLSHKACASSLLMSFSGAQAPQSSSMYRTKRGSLVSHLGRSLISLTPS